MDKTDPIDNADQIAYWNEVAGPKWVQNQDRLDRLFVPLTRQIVEAAAPQPGERVIDIGCGCGDLSLAVSKRVAPSGHVTGADVSRPMLARAAERHRTQATHVEAPGAAIDWLEADASAHDFEPADLLVSRFGVMFFAHQLVAFKNLRRALKPGGRFVMLCWRPRAGVEWMNWPLEQVASVLSPPQPEIGTPGPFGLADETATLAMLEAAGFSAVTVRPADAMLQVGEGDDPLGDAMALLRHTGPTAILLKEAEPGPREQATALLRKAVQARIANGVFALGGACWLYQGVAR